MSSDWNLLVLLLIIIIIVLVYLSHRREDTVKKLRSQMLLDEVYYLPNGRYFDLHLSWMMAWAKQYNRSFALLAISIDRLGEYQLNPKERDQLIGSVLVVVQQQLLLTDFLAIQDNGGTPCFLVIIPEASSTAAKVTAEKILEKVRGGCTTKKMRVVTVSVGVQDLENIGALENSCTRLLEQLMGCLKRAQKLGGARVVSDLL